MAVKLGEYILERRIGKGGMGQVFLAKQESLDRLVAVKVLPKELAKDDTFRARFEREAKSAASLIHPNVIQIYSFGIEKGVPYFAMEYVDGEDLSFKLKRGEKFDIKEGVRIVRDVAKALECAHRKGMVHRDIKPSNIMIASDEAVKVMDFGLAKAARVRTSITQTGLIMGTPPYMSPEQGKGEELDIRSDMYSLGIVFYELLTGILPFQADTPTAVIYQHIYETPKPIRELNPSVSESLEAIAMKLIEKKPNQRYLDPTALLADLDAYEVGAQVTASTSTPTPPQPFPHTLEIDTSPTPDTAVVQGTPSSGTVVQGTPKALLAGIAGGLAVAVVVIVLLLNAWSDKPPTVIIKPDENGRDTQQPKPADTANTNVKEGTLRLSALRAAVPDAVRNVCVRNVDDPPEKISTRPFQDISVPMGMYVLTLKRPGYEPCNITVEVTETANIPGLDEVPVEFEVKEDIRSSYARGKSLAEQQKYSEALVELRRVETEIPEYEDVEDLIALCNQHLQQTKELDDIFKHGMQYFRDGEWAKAVETLQKLPADYVKAGEAFGLLAEARDKLSSAQQLENLLREAQEALATGDLPRAETSAKSAVAIGGANEITNSVLTRVAEARELVKTVEAAEARQEYGDAVEALDKLIKLLPRCDGEKEHLALIKQLHEKQVERREKIAALLQEARFALKANDPDTAIKKLTGLLQNLDPDNQDAKLELVQARAMRTRKNITARLASFDEHYTAGRAKELAKLIDPERLQLRSQIADELQNFLGENVRIVKAGHKDLQIDFEKETASVDAMFFYEIELTEAGRCIAGTLKRRIKLVRRADIWYIASIENLD